MKLSHLECPDKRIMPKYTACSILSNLLICTKDKVKRNAQLQMRHWALCQGPCRKAQLPSGGVRRAPSTLIQAPKPCGRTGPTPVLSRQC